MLTVKLRVHDLLSKNFSPQKTFDLFLQAWLESSLKRYSNDTIR